jgi:hypothetical protein
MTQVNAQQIACFQQINISVDNTCTVALNANQFSGNAPAGSTVTVMNGINVIPQPLNTTHIGKLYTVKVTAPSGNNCWSLVKLEDKTPPALACAASPQNVNCAIQNFNLSLSQKVVFDNIPNNGIADVNIPTFGSPTVTENCAGYSLSYSDELDDTDCNVVGISAKVTRTWYVTDAAGLSNSCSVQYVFTRATLAAVTFPADITLACEANFAKDAKGNPAISVSKSPQINSVDIYPTMAGFCEIAATYHDNKVKNCGNTYEILRKWTVIDMCNSSISTKIQVIQVVDKIAPVMTCPTTDITQTTTGNNCDLVGYVIPSIIVNDNCDDAPVVTTSVLSGGVVVFSGTTITSLVVGDYVIRYTATDACGNQSTCTRKFFIKDLTPPVAVCDLNTKVALTSDGKAFLPAIDIDDNSLDNCCLDINRFEIKRAADSDANYVKVLELNCTDKT